MLGKDCTVLEIFTPGIPSRYQKKAENLVMKNAIALGMQDYVRVYCTCNRLVIFMSISNSGMQDVAKDLIKNIWGQTMRWNSSRFRWVRPIRSILFMQDDRIIPLEIAGISSSNRTTLGKPWEDSIAIPSSESYIEALLENNIILDRNKRIDAINNGIRNICSELNMEQQSDSQYLIEDNAGLSENIHCDYSFVDDKYLSLPYFVIKACLNDHQRYIVLSDKDRIAFVYFPVSTPSELIKKGNNDVACARLSDALFNFRKDLETEPYISRDHVSLCKCLCILLSIHKKTANEIYQGSYFLKSGSRTSIAGDHSSIESMMSTLIAERNGVSDIDILIGIQDHTMHNGINTDQIPRSIHGCVFSIADKIYNISQAFSRGFIPTGSSDPLGARRALKSISIIRDRMSWRSRLTRFWIVNIIQQTDARIDKSLVERFVFQRLES